MRWPFAFLGQRMNYEETVERRRRGEGVVNIDGQVDVGPCRPGGRGKIVKLSDRPEKAPKLDLPSRELVA